MRFQECSLAINKKQLLDINEPLIEVDGEVSDNMIKEWRPRELSGVYPNILQMRVDEMKDTSGNRDVNSGGAGGGVTAASAIAALQEAGNKGSRDIIAGSYRSFVEVSSLAIELMRQFYTEARSFRITNKPTSQASAMPGAMSQNMGGMPAQAMGQSGAPMGMGGDPATSVGAGMPMQPSPEYQFVEFDGRNIAEQQISVAPGGEPLFRKPIFDLEIKAQKKSPFSIMSQNELAKELFSMGAFNPERAQEILGVLMMMEFEGKEQVEDYVREGQTLLNMLQEAQGKIMQYEQMLVGLGLIPGMPAGQGGAPGMANQSGGAPSGNVPRTPVTDGVMQAQTPRSPYAESLAKRSVPSVN